jgi:hypothetical protein
VQTGRGSLKDALENARARHLAARGGGKLELGGSPDWKSDRERRCGSRSRRESEGAQPAPGAATASTATISHCCPSPSSFYLRTALDGPDLERPLDMGNLDDDLLARFAALRGATGGGSPAAEPPVQAGSASTTPNDFGDADVSDQTPLRRAACTRSLT